MRRRKILGAFALGLSSLAVAPVPAQEFARGCRRLAVPVDIEWVHAGRVTRSGAVVFADVSTGKIWYFRGSKWNHVWRPGRGSLELSRPVVVAETNEGLLLEAASHGETRFVVFDTEIVPRHALDLTELPAGEGWVLAGGVDHHFAADGSALVGHLSLRRGPEATATWWSGLAHVDLRVAPPRLARLKEIELNGPEGRYALLMGSLAASIGPRLFWLRTSAGPELVEVTGAIVRALPRPAHWPPTLPKLPDVNANSMAAAYGLIEQLSFPYALAARGKDLLVLWREASARPPAARWRLDVVDPDGQRATRQVYLPTEAPWITLLPGEGATVGFLEQGAITGPGLQETLRLVLFPGTWLELPASPLGGQVSPSLCPEAL